MQFRNSVVKVSVEDQRLGAGIGEDVGASTINKVCGSGLKAVHLAMQAVASGEVPAPRLLYTEQELREVRKLQAVAQVERDETTPLQWQERADD